MKRIVALAVFTALTLFVLSGCSSAQETVKHFDDGSVIISPGNGYGFHLLFDNVGIYSTARSTTYRIVQLADGINAENIENQFDSVFYDKGENLTPAGYYVKYAFSSDGYIALDDFDKASVKNSYILYRTADNTEKTFDSTYDLLEYADKNSIELGVWYHVAGEPEETLTVVNNWTVVKAGDDVTGVRNGNKNVFAGHIDDLKANERYISFHLKVSGDYEDMNAYDGIVNACAGNSEPIKYKPFTPTPIYCDEYVVVDTRNDTYEEFDSKKELKKFLNENNIKMQKIKI